jgi:hypothetical protein
MPLPASPERWRAHALGLMRRLADDLFRQLATVSPHQDPALLTPHERVCRAARQQGMDLRTEPLDSLLERWRDDAEGGPALREALRREVEAYVGHMQARTRDFFPQPHVQPNFWPQWRAQLTLDNAFDPAVNLVWRRFLQLPGHANLWRPEYMAESTVETLRRAQRVRHLHEVVAPARRAQAAAAAERLLQHSARELDDAMQTAQRLLLRERAERLQHQALRLSEPSTLAAVHPDAILVNELFVGPPSLQNLETRLEDVSRWLKEHGTEALPNCFQVLTDQALADRGEQERAFAAALEALRPQTYLTLRGRMLLRRSEQSELRLLRDVTQRAGLSRTQQSIDEALNVCAQRMANIEGKLKLAWEGDGGDDPGLKSRVAALAKAALALGIAQFWSSATGGLLGDHDAAILALTQLVRDHASAPRADQRRVHERVTQHVIDLGLQVCHDLEEQRHKIEADLQALRQEALGALEDAIARLLADEWSTERPEAMDVQTPGLAQTIDEREAGFPPHLRPAEDVHRSFHETVAALHEALRDTQFPPPWQDVADAVAQHTKCEQAQPWGWYQAHLRTWTSAFLLQLTLTVDS